jgi:hypothetical protein
MKQSAARQTDSQSKRDEIIRLLSDRKWRLNNLYYIQDTTGKKVKFKFNWAQEDFYHKIWYFNAILKARQLGFSTFIDIYFLDAVLFNPDKKALIIAQGKKEATDLFVNKVKFAYDNLPEQIKQMVKAEQDSTMSMRFSNGSSIEVGVSGRSGTFQYLHVSEYGKIAVKYPEKAREIKTGALNTVHAGQQIFIESTAEGQEGEFYELCKRAQTLQEMGTKLTPLDPKFHFYPWYKNASYVLSDTVPVLPDLLKYFAKLESLGIELTREQKSWYAKKSESMGDDMKREFPSTPEESFEQSVEGTYFNKEIAYLRKEGRVGLVPWNKHKPVFTWWDLGFNDDTTITFTQENGAGHDVIDYYENSLEGLTHYINYLQSLPYTYKEHVWPHDGVNTDWSTGEKRNVTAAKLGLKPIRIVERSKDLRDDHEAVRAILLRCRFDATKCDRLIKHLSAYKKEWNDKLGVWRDHPAHDAASHGVSSFRTFAVGYRERPKEETLYGSQREESWEDF